MERTGGVALILSPFLAMFQVPVIICVILFCLALVPAFSPKTVIAIGQRLKRHITGPPPEDCYSPYRLRKVTRK